MEIFLSQDPCSTHNMHKSGGHPVSCCTRVEEKKKKIPSRWADFPSQATSVISSIFRLFTMPSLGTHVLWRNIREKQGPKGSRLENSSQLYSCDNGNSHLVSPYDWQLCILRVSLHGYNRPGMDRDPSSASAETFRTAPKSILDKYSVLEQSNQYFVWVPGRQGSFR